MRRKYRTTDIRDDVWQSGFGLVYALKFCHRLMLPEISCLEHCRVQDTSCQSHIYQIDHICDQLNEATSTFHEHGLPSDPDFRSFSVAAPLAWNELTSATSQLRLSRDTSRHFCLMLRIALHGCDTYTVFYVVFYTLFFMLDYF